MHLEPRPAASGLASLLSPACAGLGAVVVTLALCAALVLAAGVPVGAAYMALLEGGFGSRFALTETLTRATPLMLTGLAAAVAFRARFFNIGAEGQLYLGALAAVAVGSLGGGLFGGAPVELRGDLLAGAEGSLAGGAGLSLASWLHLMFMFVAAMAAAAAWLLLAAVLRTALAVDEVVVTLLANFIVLLLVSLLIDGPMKDPTALGWPQSVTLPEPLQLAKLVPRSRVHTGLLLALAAAVGVWVLMRFTVLGLQMRAVGAGSAAAGFAGIPVTRTVLKTAALSGALAGLAGAVEVAGRAGYVTLDMSPGYGYSGIVVAMLAGLHPLGVVVAAIFIAGMFVGADSMSRVVGVPTYIADVIVALSLLAALVAGLLTRYRVRRG